MQTGGMATPSLVVVTIGDAVVARWEDVGFRGWKVRGRSGCGRSRLRLDADPGTVDTAKVKLAMTGACLHYPPQAPFVHTYSNSELRHLHSLMKHSIYPHLLLLPVASSLPSTPHLQPISIPPNKSPVPPLHTPKLSTLHPHTCPLFPVTHVPNVPIA